MRYITVETCLSIMTSEPVLEHINYSVDSGSLLPWTGENAAKPRQRLSRLAQHLAVKIWQGKSSLKNKYHGKKLRYLSSPANCQF